MLAAGPVVKVRVPVVLNTTSSPDAGVPPVQLPEVCQFSVVPVPPAQVFVEENVTVGRMSNSIKYMQQLLHLRFNILFFIFV